MNPECETLPPQATVHTVFVTMKTILCLCSFASFNYLKTKKERVEDLRIGHAKNIERKWKKAFFCICSHFLVRTWAGSGPTRRSLQHAKCMQRQQSILLLGQIRTLTNLGRKLRCEWRRLRRPTFNPGCTITAGRGYTHTSATASSCSCRNLTRHCDIFMPATLPV